MKKERPRMFGLYLNLFQKPQWLVMGCALGLAGCSVSLLPEKPPQRIFSLPYTAPETGAGRNNQFPPLQVNRPYANGAHDSRRIVIEIQPDELAVYSGARWVAEAPLLLREHLVKSLRQDPRMGNVVSDDSGALTALTLTSSLQAFQEDRTGNPSAVEIYLQAQLVENGTRKVLAARDFHITHDLKTETLDHSIAAFGDAATTLAAELANWIAANAPNKP